MSPDFPSACFWADNDWFVIFGWPIPLIKPHMFYLTVGHSYWAFRSPIRQFDNHLSVSQSVTFVLLSIALLPKNLNCDMSLVRTRNTAENSLKKIHLYHVGKATFDLFVRERGIQLHSPNKSNNLFNTFKATLPTDSPSPAETKPVNSLYQFQRVCFSALNAVIVIVPLPFPVWGKDSERTSIFGP